jgi:hypothetical protein
LRARGYDGDPALGKVVCRKCERPVLDSVLKLLIGGVRQSTVEPASYETRLDLHQEKAADAAPPDWYPDPENDRGWRYWNGLLWTDHRADRPVADSADDLPTQGWYPDPEGAGLRYWSGDRWTSDRADKPSAALLPLTTRGWNGIIHFDGNAVIISRQGFHARWHVGKGDKTIPLSSVTAVQWKPAGPLVLGFIQLTIPGGIERRSALGWQSVSAEHDENSVTFRRPSQAAFEVLRELITDGLTGGSDARHEQSRRTTGTVTDDLAQLARLHQAGALSDAEFAAAKARVLGL